jgi:hypothetical protein
LLGEVLGQEHDVAASFAQRRQPHRIAAEAGEQTAEHAALPARRGRLAQAGDDARGRLVAALAELRQQLDQLHLPARVERADLGKKQRAAAATREALLRAVGPLASGRVDHQERLLAGGSRAVQQACERQLLGAGLTLDQHRRAAPERAAHVLPRLIDARTLADQHVAHRVARRAGRRPNRCCARPRVTIEAALDHVEQVLGEPRGLEAGRHEIAHAGLQGRERRLRLRIGREQDDADVGALSLDASRDGHTVVEAALVGDDQDSVAAALEQRQGFVVAARGVGRVARVGQDRDQHLARGAVCIEHEQARACARAALLCEASEDVHLVCAEAPARSARSGAPRRRGAGAPTPR